MLDIPTWLADVLQTSIPVEGELYIEGSPYVVDGGILRSGALYSETQGQTATTFGDKWHRRETFESEASLSRMRQWLIERYGDVSGATWWDEYGPHPLVIDAGCGAAMSAIELFGARLRDVRYVGIDVSNAVDVAAQRFSERNLEAGFIQADIVDPPVPPGTANVVFSEGVLHHTDSTERALYAVARLLAPGGRLLFYVYRRKGPVREFTDDYIRERIRGLSADEAWEALLPLTRLGQALGDLDVEVDVPADIDLLGIPAGRISVQRLFYWHVVKAFANPALTLDELNHINFDWFAPANAHRQTVDQVREWCTAAGLEIERERVEEAGITMIARRPHERELAARDVE